MLKKIMVVEDSSLQTKIYQMFFSHNYKCKIVAAANGFQAMDNLALEVDIDLIVLDINMPKMNGFEFLVNMRQKGFNRIPVIIVSTEDNENGILKAMELGARAFIKKPWDPNDLKTVIHKIMSGKPN